MSNLLTNVPTKQLNAYLWLSVQVISPFFQAGAGQETIQDSLSVPDSKTGSGPAIPARVTAINTKPY
jgi:hypothetical protein